MRKIIEFSPMSQSLQKEWPVTQYITPPLKNPLAPLWRTSIVLHILPLLLLQLGALPRFRQRRRSPQHLREYDLAVSIPVVASGLLLSLPDHRRDGHRVDAMKKTCLELVTSPFLIFQKIAASF